MKAKHVFTTLGIALTMGLGVVAGLSHAKVIKPAKAAVSRTVYCAIDTTTLGSYTLKLNANVGDNNTWLQSNMVDLGDTTSYPGKKVFSGTFDERWGGVDAMQFQLYNGDTWVEEDEMISSWTTSATYSNKLHVYGGSGWTDYTPSVFDVNVYVDGELRGVEHINQGSLPDNPSFTFGQVFSGWFDDEDCTPGHEVEYISSATTVYGKVITLPTVTYNLDTSRVSSLSNPYLYAFDTNGKENHAWPGVSLGEATSFTVPNNAKIILNNNDKIQTVNIDQSGIANDTLRLVTEGSYTSEGTTYYNGIWASSIDEPAEDGYYLVGTKTDFKYADAPKMTQVDPALTGNVAVLYGYTAAVDEKINVRSFFSGADNWATNIDGTKAYGETVGNDFVFSKAGQYDIYAYYEADVFKFSVVEAAEQVTVTLVAQKFEGATARGGETIGTVQVVSGQKYTVPTHAISGWRQDGAFTDNTCTAAYDDTVALTENTIIYVRYMKIGFFRIAGADSWSIYAANAMITDGIADSNKAEDTVVVAAANETYSFVYYDENGAMSGQDGLGAEYDFAVYEDSHIKFTKAGTYAVYWNKTNNLVYLNAGATAFYTGFISEIGGICQNNGSTNIESLQAAWLHQKAVYNTLDDDEKATIVAKTINGGNKDGDLLEQVIAKYHYIVVEKYGTGVCEDFIWGQTYPSNQMNPTWPNVAFIVIVSVSSALLVAGVSTLILLKRKKHF